MNYSSYLMASWICVLLGYSQATVKADVDSLMKHFNVSTSSDISDNGSLFLSMMGRWKEDSDKKIIMSQIVAVYFKIFETVKNNTIIKKSLENVKEDMIMKFFPNNTASKMNDFEAVINTQVNDLKVQKKAIFELKQIIHDLSSGPHQKRRKRRQNRNQGEIKL
ncbi:interferon gamma [Petaurus breviceps papuanus]|uniref:interferon gamma n=1 Tax=Petaurus breviceps papuanus TaxID=3040969 RepID=UPI0036DE0ABE